MTFPLALYGAVTGLLEPLAPAVLVTRVWRGKEDPDRIYERLGRSALPRPDGPLAWLHAVSVGEAMSVLPLAKALRARRPDLTVLITTGTLTSAHMLEGRIPAGAIHQFAPVDSPKAVAGFLDHWRPDLAVFVESELWPNMLLECSRRGLRLALVSARMTKRSARGWGRVPASAKILLNVFDLVLPQDLYSRDRLAGLGAIVGPSVNLKLLGEPLSFDKSSLSKLWKQVAGRKVVFAASTHPGEDALIGRAIKAATQDALLMVAPRHPFRGDEVSGVLSAQGYVVAQRSKSDRLTAQTTAYVADSMGQLGLFFRIADVVIMGGSFVSGIGGHNPLEPARFARSIVTGEQVENAREIYAELVAAGAAVMVPGEAELAAELDRLLADASARDAMGAAALGYTQAQGRALDHALGLLTPLLPA